MELELRLGLGLWGSATNTRLSRAEPGGAGRNEKMVKAIYQARCAASSCQRQRACCCCWAQAHRTALERVESVASQRRTTRHYVSKRRTEGGADPDQWRRYLVSQR